MIGVRPLIDTRNKLFTAQHSLLTPGERGHRTAPVTCSTRDFLVVCLVTVSHYHLPVIFFKCHIEMIVKIKTGTLHYMPAKQRGDCFTCYLLASKQKKIFTFAQKIFWIRLSLRTGFLCTFSFGLKIVNLVCRILLFSNLSGLKKVRCRFKVYSPLYRSVGRLHVLPNVNVFHLIHLSRVE